MEEEVCVVDSSLVCSLCGKEFTNLVLKSVHMFQVHGVCDENDEGKKVRFDDNIVCFEEGDENKLIRQKKIRFEEVTNDIENNKEWLNNKHKINEEEIMYAEIKETEDNKELCDKAKKKELKNFDDYKVYEEVEYNDQDVLGTRFVLTQKPDGSVKARFVVKGFQEEKQQSDSPTASRDTFKVFCSVAGNEKWEIEGSDVRAAFLQSEDLEREVFIEPPPQRRKPGLIWKLRKPAYGLNDASR